MTEHLCRVKGSPNRNSCSAKVKQTCVLNWLPICWQVCKIEAQGLWNGTESWFSQLLHDKNLWWALHRTCSCGCLASDWKKEELFYSVSPLFIDMSLLVFVMESRHWTLPACLFRHVHIMCCDMFYLARLVMLNLCSWYSCAVVLTVPFLLLTTDSGVRDPILLICLCLSPYVMPSD